MKLPKNPAVSDVTIEGLVFKIPSPFAEGHVVTANEAAALNQTFRENIRNNFASKAKSGKEAGTSPEALQADLDKYISEYEFGVRHGGGGARVVDPIEREVRDIATAAVLAALQKAGVAKKDVSKEQLKQKVDEAIEKYGPKLRQKAKAAVEARNSALSGLEL